MKKLSRTTAFALITAALCLSLTGCGISDIFKNDGKTPDGAEASPSVPASS